MSIGDLFILAAFVLLGYAVYLDYQRTEHRNQWVSDCIENTDHTVEECKFLYKRNRQKYCLRR